MPPTRPWYRPSMLASALKWGCGGIKASGGACELAWKKSIRPSTRCFICSISRFFDLSSITHSSSDSSTRSLRISALMSLVLSRSTSSFMRSRWNSRSCSPLWRQSISALALASSMPALHLISSAFFTRASQLLISSNCRLSLCSTFERSASVALNAAVTRRSSDSLSLVRSSLSDLTRSISWSTMGSCSPAFFSRRTSACSASISRNFSFSFSSYFASSARRIARSLSSSRSLAKRASSISRVLEPTAAPFSMTVMAFRRRSSARPFSLSNLTMCSRSRFSMSSSSSCNAREASDVSASSKRSCATSSDSD
mmetsp:Transcript_7522/g.17199  ORF Transcript_7522/g.17199 Transcript_7522/m.17199 type:complete len:312 (-) Transcript_7522:531-1466(-)